MLPASALAPTAPSRPASLLPPPKLGAMTWCLEDLVRAMETMR